MQPFKGETENLMVNRAGNDTSSLSGSDSFLRQYGQPRTVTWSVRDFRVHIEPFNNYTNLTEPERANVFDSILKEVRKRSRHPDKFYSAALAVTDSGHIYVANNTQQQHEYHKDCSEMNLVNIMRQLEPKAKISRLYLTAGPDSQEPNRPYAPCGKCMDTLCGCSLPGAMITMFPTTRDGGSVRVTNSASHADEVPPGMAWETSLCGLLIDSKLPLNEAGRKRGEQGWEALTNGTLPAKSLNDEDIHRIRFGKRKQLSPEDFRMRDIMERAASNAAKGKRSEAELDADNSPASINHFMVNKIANAYHHRPEALMKGQKEAETVRCVVLRLADGTFHSVTEVEGPHENAVPHAEITATAISRETHQSITDVWVMRMNREEISQGVLRTSPKESIERLNKRAAKRDDVTDNQGKPIKNTVNMHYIVFNDGSLKDDEVNAITYRFSTQDLFPSRFRGSKHDRISGREGSASSSGMTL